MSSRIHVLEDARWRAERSLAELGDECRRARLAAGLTLQSVASRLGWSRQRAARLERGRVHRASYLDLSLYSAVLGLRTSLRAFPAGSALRDVAQLEVTQRFLSRLGAAWRAALEVPLPLAGDLRAFDLVLRTGSGDLRIYVEVLTRLTDLQAQLRAIGLKWRDGAGGQGRLVLVIAATAANRRVLRAARDLLRDEFPLDTRELMAELAAGRDPGANGIALI